ncbi:MAG: agmatinase [Clostridia bacterium]|nr:agmatinase [Clostridia bacterium]
MNKNISTFIGCDSTFEEAEIVVFGAPFDGTTSFRPGTRFAPGLMRLESYGLETYSPYLDIDLEDYYVFDGGDLELPFGNTQRVLDAIENFADEIVSAGKIPFMVGGEHLVSLPNLKAVHKRYPEVSILHFDAHADLRSDYMGEALSHATVMRRIWNVVGDDKIYQFGIRSFEKAESEFSKYHATTEKFSCETVPSVVAALKDKPVYVTIDLDILDPSVFPGTGTIEPGGITFKELLTAVHSLTGLNIVGADIVELSPHNDTSGLSTAVACKVLRELLLTILA